VTVPDLPAAEAYHAAVTAAIGRAGNVVQGFDWTQTLGLHRALADRALEGLGRHYAPIPGGLCCCGHRWPCPDALDAWADLTDIGTTYGVKT
jgi:hypothetical protein